MRRHLPALYAHFDGEELDRRALLAERLMNEALDQRRWHLVRRRRTQLLAFDAERRRRRTRTDAGTGHAAS